MHRDLSDWLYHLERVERRSPQTIRSYARGVADYIAHVERRRRSVRRANQLDVLAFVAALDGPASTVRQRLSAVKSFHRWLCDYRRVKDNPAAPVKLPPPSERRVCPPSIAHVALVLAAHDDSRRGVRDRAIVSMLYGCGLRVGELCALRIRDVDLTMRRVYVHGKGDKYRNVPVPRGSARDLQRWLELRGSSSGYVFPGPGVEGKRRGSSIRRALGKAALRAGLDRRRFHPHALRHAYAVHLLTCGADIRTIQRLLGHSSITTTCIYLQLDITQLQTCIDTLHPLAQRPTPATMTTNPWNNWRPKVA